MDRNIILLLAFGISVLRFDNIIHIVISDIFFGIFNLDVIGGQTTYSDAMDQSVCRVM